jgi:hypothetical protein
VLHRDGVDLIDESAQVRHESLLDLAPHLVVPRLLTATPRRPGRSSPTWWPRARGCRRQGRRQPYAAGRRGSGWVKVKPRHTSTSSCSRSSGGRGAAGHPVEHPPRGRDPDRRLRDDRQDVQGHDRRDAALADRAVHRARGRGTEGWVVQVRPEQVVEIAFDGLQRSTRYPGGVALRFARVLRYRDDKAPTRPTRSPRCRRWRPDPTVSTRPALPLTARGSRRGSTRGRVRPARASARPAARPSRGRPWPSRSPGSSPRAQADLVRETEPARMAQLDEDDLLDLHTRVRRARSKYVKLYRQTGQSRVGLKGAAWHARPGNVGQRRQGGGVRAGPGPGQRPRRRGRPRRGRRSSRPSGSRRRAAPRLDGSGSAAAGAGSKAARHQHPSARDQDHRWHQARRVVAAKGAARQAKKDSR